MAQVRPSPPPLVLVVEDDADVRDTLRELFEDEGYRVATAEDGRVALELLERIDRPGVILLDLNLPEMSGTAFLDAARRKFPGLARVPVVVLTGYAQLALAVRDVTRTLMKPADLGTLLAVVRQVCRVTPSHRHA